MATPETGRNIIPVNASRKEVITVFNQVYELTKGRVGAGSQSDLPGREFAVMQTSRKNLVGSDNKRVPENIASDRFSVEFRDCVQNKGYSLREGISVTAALDILNQNLDELGVDISHSTEDPKGKKELMDVFGIRFRQLQIMQAYSSPYEPGTPEEREARIRLEAFENAKDPLRNRGEEQNWLDGEEVVDRFVFLNFPKDGKNFSDFLLSLVPNRPDLSSLRIEMPIFPSFIEPLTPDEVHIPELGNVFGGLREMLGRGRERVCRTIKGLIEPKQGGLIGSTVLIPKTSTYRIRRSSEFIKPIRRESIMAVLKRGKERLDKHKCRSACCIPLALLALTALLALCNPRDSINKPVTDVTTPASSGKLGGHPVEGDDFPNPVNKPASKPARLTRSHHYTNEPGPDGSYGSLRGQGQGMLAEYWEPSLVGKLPEPDDDLLHEVLEINENADRARSIAYLDQYIQDTVLANPEGAFDGDKIMKPDFVSPEMKDEVNFVERLMPDTTRLE